MLSKANYLLCVLILFVNTFDSKIHVVVNGNVHITFVIGLQVK